MMWTERVYRSDCLPSSLEDVGSDHARESSALAVQVTFV